MSSVTDVHARLTDEEVDAVKTYSQLEQALFTLHIVPVQERMKRVVRRIEERLGMEGGAIGKTHRIDGDPLAVVEAD